MQAYKCFKVFNCLKKVNGDEEMAFHANQGLWIFALEVIAVICGIISGIGTLLFMVFGFLAAFLSIKGIAGIRDNKPFEIPVISNIQLVK